MSSSRTISDSTARSVATEPWEADVAVELSIVMPCLDEAETVGVCVEKARAALLAHGIASEIVVADNGSRDGSQEIARAAGARVVTVRERGYGYALMGGIAAARGTFILMGDADDSYDFGEALRFLERLREGYDLVQGCRLTAGGGTVLPGAMPVLHRLWGNPMFSAIARHWFRAPIHDVYCGMRAFRKSWYQGLDQRCAGMEFATEMIVKASLFGARVAEVPITLHPDGRRLQRRHLRTFRDGWRTLRFLLLYSPRWLFLLPGLVLVMLGLVGYALALPGFRVMGAHLDAHTLLFASLWIICGYQAVLFAVMTKSFAINEGLMPPDRRFEAVFRVATLERGILLAIAAMLVGGILLVLAILQWRAVGFGHLDYSRTMRLVIPGVTLCTLGFQTLLSSFFVSVLGMPRRRWAGAADGAQRQATP